MAAITIPLDEMRRKIIASVEVNESGCWIWKRARQTNGYGSVSAGGRGNSMLAHRASYEAFVGPVPAGLTLDHLCHTEDSECPGGVACWHRPCVNPKHLEPVTQDENNRRGLSPWAVNARRTHCKHGHELTAANTITKKDGRRNCRTCQYAMSNARGRARYAEQKAAAAH